MEMMDPMSKRYFVPGARVWERRICGKNTPLPGKAKKVYVTNKYEISVP